ncbi:HNH endonuclease [Natronosalvus amylolyticus]|uniref:HNH endonuclease n=1 Tax=Natronosalvus amylolyticus TaxID=2961994 RepID=UPI0020C9B4F9|nr:HNH endonuclease signature motif containing protein [Natronosalvus amylolyticus]
MGVVRREGDWRLEKENDGLYMVTYQKRTEAIITTPEYKPQMFDDSFHVGVTEYGADSAAEAREVFEDIVENNSASILPGLGRSDSGNGAGFPAGSTGTEQSNGLEDLPPGGIALVMLLAGGSILFSGLFEFGTVGFYIGAVLILTGLAIIAWAIAIYNKEGPKEAWSFLITLESGNESDTESDTGDTNKDTVEHTPPTPQKMRDELYFERANQQCEWCGKRTDHPEVHHIKPRSEGGPNEPSNLIVLCPEDHSKADSGGISRTKLRAKVRRQTELKA